VAWQAIGNEVIVVDFAGAKTLGLNPVGSLVWTLLPDHEEPAIAEAVARRFDVPLATARRDVAAFLQMLRERDLVGEAG
jgi:hypothetical protein